MEVKFKLEYDLFENLFINAWCGGSTYWASIDSSAYEDYFSKENPHNTIDAKTAWELWNNSDFYVNVYDVENVMGEELLGVLNKANIEPAFQLMAEQFPEHFTDAVSENDDAITADVFFQLFTMKDVIYG